jgi:hypothetical protein
MMTTLNSETLSVLVNTELERALQEERMAIQRYKRGNTALIEALMDMVNQFFASREINGEEVLYHSFMSAEEEAISILLEAGFAERVFPDREGYRLLWDKLEARKNEEQD